MNAFLACCLILSSLRCGLVDCGVSESDFSSSLNFLDDFLPGVTTKRDRGRGEREMKIEKCVRKKGREKEKRERR